MSSNPPSSLCWHLGLRSFWGSPLRFRSNDQPTAQSSNEIYSGLMTFGALKTEDAYNLQNKRQFVKPSLWDAVNEARNQIVSTS